MWAPEPIGREVTEEEADVLAEVHREKIRRSDLVVVIPKIDESLGEAVRGEAVRAEAAYAEKIGKEVVYL